MVTDLVRQRIEAWKGMAEIFLKENKQVFIKNANDDYYFGDILFVGDEKITIDCVAPEQRIGKHNINWVSIIFFDERRDK